MKDYLLKASDYDDWETIHSNAGWGSKDLLPLLRKVSQSMLKIDLRKSNRLH